MSEEEEKGCEQYLVDGKCPKYRWSSDDCPLNVVEGGYALCCEKKE